MDPSQGFKTLQENVQSALVSTTRLANQIAAEDLSFQRTSNPAIAEELDDVSSRLLSLTSSLLHSATRGTDVTAPSLEDADDVDVHWTRVVDIVDNLLEKADTCLDEYTGAIKRKAGPAEQQQQQQPAAGPAKKPRYNLDQSMRRANVLKPQNAFEVKPDNYTTSPWKPLISAKPHATVPLEKSLETFRDEGQSIQYKHPYETEIINHEYPESVFQKQEPINYLPFESTTATFVDTFEGVLEMLEELKGAKEIAIDTEHHDFRTYTGLLSLMQISTREKDWIVDTLQPWRHKLEVLNEVFADPNIVKVLHGAYMDIIWLQRDCGLYIVGLFDTFEAASALGYPGRSLAYLLKRFVDFDADKKYQLADWRIRPLPEEMFYYARSDTHYLLYIYDQLRNELLSSSPGTKLMEQVLSKSKETSLRRYETIVYDAKTGEGPFGWFNLLVRQSIGKLSKEQFSVFRAIHQWRDQLARKEDESPLFVMSNATLFDITRRLPPDPKALHSLLDSKSYLAKREVSSLFEVVTKAIEDGPNGPSVAEFLRGNAPATMSVGEVAQAVFPQRFKDGVDAKELIATSSRLWGDVPLSSRWDPPSRKPTPKLVSFELPWAPFLQTAKLADDTSSQDPDQAMTTAEAIAVVKAEEEEDEMMLENNEFTLKAGIKRKAQEVEEDSESEPESETATAIKQEKTTGEEEISLLLDSDEERKNKKARKAEKRARKRAQKEERKALRKTEPKEEEEEEEEGEEEEPFDYAKAKSVLKADKSKAAPPKKARFNQFSMVNDGPKPARRLHGEKLGKSATFKK
ncbi:ribonuclease H-like domain-containing protein [Poronia punctata]|nr:ribonuclease H-like domain-containing protein [Poronia punctata]